MKKQIVFFTIFILTLIFYLFSPLYTPFFLSVVLALLLFLLLMSLFAIRKKNLSIDIKANTTIPKETENEICFHIHNRNWFPLTHGVLDIEIVNELTKEKTDKRLSVSAPIRSNVTTCLNVSSKYCGKISIRVKEFTILDLLGIFKRRMKIDEKNCFYVVPNSHHQSIEQQSPSVKEFDGIEINTVYLGDSTDYLQLKPYQPGDSVKKIHWKLSSKLREFVIKETSSPLTSTLVLFLETNYQRMLSAEEIDSLMERYIAYANYFIAKRIPIEVAYYEEDFLQRYEVESVEKLESLLADLLQVSITDHSSVDSLDTLLKLDKAIVYITAEREVEYLPDEEGRLIVPEDLDKRVAI